MPTKRVSPCRPLTMPIRRALAGLCSLKQTRRPSAVKATTSSFVGGSLLASLGARRAAGTAQALGVAGGIGLSAKGQGQQGAAASEREKRCCMAFPSLNERRLSGWRSDLGDARQNGTLMGDYGRIQEKDAGRMKKS